MANEVAVLKKTEMIEQIGLKLEEMIDSKLNAVPKGFNKTRFIQNSLSVLSDTKDIEKCRPMSVVRSLVKGAYLNLDFFRKECYVIVYNNNIGTKDKPEWVKDAQFQTDYKGEIKLCKKYGRGIKDIYAKIVQEGDDLSIGIDSGLQRLNFTPKPFNNGEIKGAFAVIIFDNGIIKYDTMSVKDIEDVRKNYSKSADGPSWVKSWAEMAKKTVLRRLCKLEDLDFENKYQVEAYEDGGDADFTKKALPSEKNKIINPFEEDVKVTGISNAEVVNTTPDPDADLKAALKKQFPNEEDWQIDVRIKESRGQA